MILKSFMIIDHVIHIKIMIGWIDPSEVHSTLYTNNISPSDACSIVAHSSGYKPLYTTYTCHTSSFQWSINESILIIFSFMVPSRWARLSFRCPRFLPILSRAPSSATNLCTVCSWRGSGLAPCQSSPSSWSYISCDPSQVSGSWASSTVRNLDFNHKHTIVYNFLQFQVNNNKNKKCKIGTNDIFGAGGVGGS